MKKRKALGSPLSRRFTVERHFRSTFIGDPSSDEIHEFAELTPEVVRGLMVNWSVVPEQGQFVRDLREEDLSRALAVSDHFRVWLTSDFAVGLEKVEDDGFLCEIHLRGIDGFGTKSPLSLEKFKESVVIFLTSAKRTMN